MRLRPLICGVCCCALLAQDRPATFRTDTNLVIVNITVRDKSGKLLDNLKKEDFVLTEDDKAQPISVFEVEHLSGDVLPPVVAPQNSRPSQIALAPKDSPRAAAPAPPTADNAAASRKDRRLLALYFDFSSMQPPEQIRAQQAALKFLNEQMTSSDLVAISDLFQPAARCCRISPMIASCC